MSQDICTKKLLDPDIRIVITTKKPEDLLKAYKKEKDPKAKTRTPMLLFLEDDMDVADIMKCNEK